MKIHTFGSETGSVIVLIHGMLTPWQIWQTAIDRFSQDHFVIVPELDAHTEDAPSEFVSIEDEAEKLREYLDKSCGGRVFAICGLSMGGRIAATLAKLPGISTEYLVLDGAPLLPVKGMVKNFMRASYIRIVRKSKKRDPKTLESFKRVFLPDKHLESYLKIADNMDEQSIRNIIDSVFGKFEFVSYGGDCRVLFMHGTRGNESVAKRGALRMKEAEPRTEIRCYEGYAHAQLACFEEEKWVSEVCGFLGI